MKSNLVCWGNGTMDFVALFVVVTVWKSVSNSTLLLNQHEWERGLVGQYPGLVVVWLGDAMYEGCHPPNGYGFCATMGRLWRLLSQLNSTALDKPKEISIKFTKLSFEPQSFYYKSVSSFSLWPWCSLTGKPTRHPKIKTWGSEENVINSGKSRPIPTWFSEEKAKQPRGRYFKLFLIWGGNTSMHEFIP